MAVIIRAHLDAPYLLEAINSVENQDYLGEIEIIIVTDRVNKEKIKIIENRQSRFEIKVLNNLSKNIAVGLNLAIRSTDAVFIAILDSDDRMMPTRISKQIKLIKQNNYSALGSNLELINEFGVKIGNSYMPQNEEVINLLPIISTIAHPSSTLVKESVLEIGGYREFFALAEDYDLFIRLSEKFSIGNSNEFLTQYRIHPKQLTKSRIKQHVWAALATKYSQKQREAGKIDLPWIYKDVNDWKINGANKFLRYLKFIGLVSKSSVSQSDHVFQKFYHSIIILIFDPVFIFTSLKKKLKTK